MKILIFEYITGGGFCAETLPPNLAREGLLMLNALLNDFSAIPEHEIYLLLDYRYTCQLTSDVLTPFNISLQNTVNTNPSAIQKIGNLTCLPIQAKDNIIAVFTQALQNCAAVWLIAPETAGILLNFTQLVQDSGKQLFGSPVSAIAKTADKFQTFTILKQHAITTVATQRLDNYDNSFNGAKMLKLIDGVGCEESCLIPEHFDIQQIKLSQEKSRYIVQPFITGDTFSLSAIFYHGTAQLLCVNRQHFILNKQQFQLTACEVNIFVAKTMYQNILQQIAQAFPDLYGYVGVDFIQQAEKIVILEINPRLTSSYVGIHSALNLNVAESVLQLTTGKITIPFTKNETVLIQIAEENTDVD